MRDALSGFGRWNVTQNKKAASTAAFLLLVPEPRSYYENMLIW